MRVARWPGDWVLFFAKIRTKGTKFKLKHKECRRMPLNVNVSKQWSKLVAEVVK